MGCVAKTFEGQSFPVLSLPLWRIKVVLQKIVEIRKLPRKGFGYAATPKI
jgi:hypothetical protein